MTVKIGLKNAALLELGMLSLGGVLCALGFILEFSARSLALLSTFLFIMAAGYVYILSKYVKLYKLTRKLNQSLDSPHTEQDLVGLAAENPKWITLITQSIVIECLVLLVSKFL